MTGTYLHFDVERVAPDGPAYERHTSQRMVVHVRRGQVMTLIAKLSRAYSDEVDFVSVHLDVEPHADNVNPLMDREQALRHALVAIGVKAQEDGNEAIRCMVASTLWEEPRPTQARSDKGQRT